MRSSWHGDERIEGMSGSCGGYNRVISDGTIYPCRSQATATILAGCIHEHAGPRDLCDYHTSEVQAGGMTCGECLEAATPHACYLVAARPLVGSSSGERTSA